MLTPYAKRKERYKLEKNDKSNVIWKIKQEFLNTNAFYHPIKSWLTHHSSRVHIFSNLWHIELKLHTYLDKNCIYHVSKYCYQYIAPLFCCTIPFWDPGVEIHGTTGCVKNHYSRQACRHINYAKLNTILMLIPNLDRMNISQFWFKTNIVINQYPFVEENVNFFLLHSKLGRHDKMLRQMLSQDWGFKLHESSILKSVTSNYPLSGR